jgi:hypothetical protein
VNADAGEGVAHLVELERFDNGDDQFHDYVPGDDFFVGA